MHHSRALILMRAERGEADWLISALTPGLGKIHLRVQGARKHGAKLRGHLEPGTLADISFVVGRNGYRLTSARLAEPFLHTRGSWPKLSAQSALLATIEANLLAGGEDAGSLFAIAVAAMAAIEQDERGAPGTVIAWFYASFLRILGFLPAAGTPEAQEIPMLLLLAARPLGEVVTLGVRPEALAGECAAIARRLGRTVRLAAPVPAPEPALY